MDRGHAVSDRPTVIRIRWGSAGLFLLFLACGEDQPSAIPDLKVEEWEAVPIAAAARFASIRDMFLAGDFLWVLDGAPPFVTRVTLETGEVLRFGEKGNGPGEFVEPWAIQPALASDSSGILIWDFGSYRVTQFDVKGMYVSSAEMSQAGRPLVRPDFRDVSYADPYRVRNTARGVLSVSFERRIDRTADFRLGDLHHSSVMLDSIREVVRMGDLIDPGVESLKEWAAMPFWDVCGEELALWSPATKEIIWFGRDNRPRARTTLPFSQHPTELDDIERYLERMARLELGPEDRAPPTGFRSMARRYRTRFASKQPLVTDLRCQGPGLVWIRRFATESDPLGKGLEWIAIDKDGPLKHLRVPSGSTPFLFTAGHVVGTMILPPGDQVIARFIPPSTQPFSSH